MSKVMGLSAVERLPKGNGPLNGFDARAMTITVTPPLSDVSDQSAEATLVSASNEMLIRPSRSLRYSPFTLQNQLLPEPNFALMSNLASHFMYWVKTLNATRKLYCTEEYPYSFDGEEAITILQSLLSDAFRSKFYRHMARSLLNTQPPLFKPTHYATRSIRKQQFYQSNKEIYTLTSDAVERDCLPHGVYYPLTPCYAPRCQPGDPKCYAPCCPNRMVQHMRVKPHTSQSLYTDASLSLTSSYSLESAFSRTWTMTVPREILQSTPEPERLRQEAIYELIYTEEDYVGDLRLLDELFGKPLQTAQCLPQDRRAWFCEQVFSNYKQILDCHRVMYQELREYQALCQSVTNGVLDRIGNIILRQLTILAPLYRFYGPQFTLADFYVKKELRDNILFQNFIREQEKQPEAHKLHLRDYLVRPVTRLLRYPLLFTAILKHTPTHHLDNDDLQKAATAINSIVQDMNEATTQSIERVRPLQIHDQLQAKPQSPQLPQATIDDLQLLEPDRQLVFEGDLIRRNPLMESIPIHLFLFDHLLIMTKPKRSPGVTNHMPITNPSIDYNNYVISKLPIPMDLLSLQPLTQSAPITEDEPIVQHRHNLPTPGTNSTDASPTRHHHPRHRPTLYPIVFTHLGRQGNQYTLFASSPQDQAKWHEAIADAKAKWDLQRSQQRVFQMRLLTDHTFGPTITAGAANESIPFTAKDGKAMVVFNTSSGIWVGSVDGTVVIQQVLSLLNVVQIGIMHDCHILMVLANDTLTAYALDQLDPRYKVIPPAFQRISSQGVQFFSCGVTSGQSVLITMKRKGADSHFKTWTPVCGDLRDPRYQKNLHARTGFLSKPTWFKMRTGFYIGAMATSIQLLAARVAIVCDRGFEIINLDALQTRVSLPDLENQTRLDFSPDANAQPLAMFKCQDGFLLCYTTFAIRVDSYGKYDPTAYKRIDWIGTPERVALFYPFVLAFDHQLIEIRNVETGELTQVMTGSRLKSLCTTPRIHGSMAHTHDRNYQLVFELVPVQT